MKTNVDSSQNPSLSITASRQFASWLAAEKLSLVFTTYQLGKIFFVGLKDNNEISIFERTFNRCMGLYVKQNSLYLSSLFQLWIFENALKKGELHKGQFDCLFIPQLAYITGDLDIHDLAVDKQERLIFVNTLFSCLATVNSTHSFIPLWYPSFITKLAAEDRCHLNGLAMVDGLPRYVTSVSQSDIADGWREHRHNGGCVLEVPSGEIITTGLSMPHSPRYYRNRLWVLNSGFGEFGYVDLDSGKFNPVTFCPGYLRGLAFHQDYAIVGLSKPRQNQTFSGLPLDDILKQKQAEARCAIYIINLNTGDIVHWLRIEGIVEELYDVAILPNVVRPMAIGIINDEIRQVLSVGDIQPL